jgi:CheY-like chemotaxis protein
METILIVEDQEANREFLAALLQYRGCRVLTAGNGEDALAVAREARPDLVIADVLMPRMDGYEFVRQLRKDPVIGSMKVIFYTASYVEEESRVLAQACGSRASLRRFFVSLMKCSGRMRPHLHRWWKERLKTGISGW